MTPQGPTWEYLHLVANPFAVVLTAVGAAAGLGGWLAGREGLERWGVLALLLGGVMAIPAYLTGLTAADVVSTRTFVRPSLVQSHRAWATWALVALLAQGAFAAFALVQPAEERLRRFVLLVGLAAAILTGWVAYLGGKIVHGPEADAERIRERVHRPPPAASPGAAGAGAAAAPRRAHRAPTGTSSPMRPRSPAAPTSHEPAEPNPTETT